MTNGEKMQAVFPDIEMWGESKDTLDYSLGGMIHRVTKSWWNAEYKEPKTGHWIRELIRNEKGGCIGAKMICSECGNDNKHDEYMNYCPNCGARMDEPQERSDKE